MQNLNFQIVSQWVMLVGAVLLGLGYLYSQFSRGRKGAAKEDLEKENALTTYLRNQVSGFEGLIKDQNNKITELSHKVVGLQATIDEKDKLIDKYLQILQNRNPELENFIRESKENQAAQLQVMLEIKNFMHSINAHMETHNKDLKIEATVSQKV